MAEATIQTAHPSPRSHGHLEWARASARGWLRPWLLLAPGLFFLVTFFLLPITKMGFLSLFDPDFTLRHYVRAFTVPIYATVMWNTIVTSVVVTVCCLILGYPFAYVMATRRGAMSLVLMACVGISFWTGFVVRTYAWLIILGQAGPVASLIAAFGIKPPQMLFTTLSSNLALVHVLLPYMVFSLYAVMRRIDLQYLRAAANLGASPWAGFRAVFFPLSAPGVVNGCVLVFSMCLGFFVTPLLLGSPRDMMISQLISQQIEQLLAWGFASSLAMVLLGLTVSLLLVYNRFFGLNRLWG